MTLPSQTLSVVVVARQFDDDLRRCLTALLEQDRAPDEIVVGVGGRPGEAAAIVERFPSARIVEGACWDGLAELRARAVAETTGDIVALTDVYCCARGDWARRLLGQPWASVAAVGGVVAPLPRRRQADWAAFLCEYAAHLPGRTAGPAAILSGNNVAFRRDALLRAQIIGRPAFWKTLALQRLAAVGERFRVDPQLVVYHWRTQALGAFVRQRYLHGRCFAGQQAAGQSRSRRLLRAAREPLVPIVLFARLAGSLRGNELQRTFWNGLPFQTLFQAAWAWGELTGYLGGSGDACRLES